MLELDLPDEQVVEGVAVPHGREDLVERTQIDVGGEAVSEFVEVLAVEEGVFVGEHGEVEGREGQDLVRGNAVFYVLGLYEDELLVFEPFEGPQPEVGLVGHDEVRAPQRVLDHLAPVQQHVPLDLVGAVPALLQRHH